MRRCGLRLRRQISVQGGDHLRAFADGGRDPLGRARADIETPSDGLCASLKWLA